MKVTKELLQQWNEEFYKRALPITSHPNFQSQKNISHHHHTTIYNHVIEVSRICFIIAKKKEHSKKPYDIDSLLTATLLHDYFLYNWRTTQDRPRPHLYKHAQIAIKNAERDFGPLSDKIKNIIETHMWPAVFYNFPKSREAWLLTRIDKYVSIKDFFYFNKKEK